MKVIANATILFVFFTILVFINDRQRILVICSLIFFPMVIKLGGKDAFTISTALIYIFSIKYFLESKTKLQIDIVAVLILILIIFGAISTINVPKNLFWRAARKYSDFASSLLLLGYIYYQFSHLTDNKHFLEFINKFFSVILIMVTSQVLISILIWRVPYMKFVFSYFTFSNVEEITAYSEGITSIQRMKSLIYGPEAFAESIAVICPIVMYKFLKNRKILWFLLYIVLFYGIIYTRTRSGIFLFAIATILYLLFNIKNISSKTSIILIYGISFFIFSVIFWGNFYIDALIRFEESLQAYESGNYLEAINRPGFFENFIYVFDHMGYWGNGLLSIYDYTGGTHLHSLYQTIIFQFGLFGSIVYFFFLYFILIRLLRTFLLAYKTEYKMLAFSLLLSYLIFLTNEFKYEFNRGEAYQQISWALFGAYMLGSRYIIKITKSKNSIACQFPRYEHTHINN